MKKLILLPLFVLLTQLSFSQSTIQQEFDTILNTELKPNEPGGAILIAKKGEIIYKKAFGMADMELDVQVKDSMIFYIGSNTKQFTAVAILQLHERGLIALTDTLGNFFAHCPHPVSGITIAQLLSHTSGLSSNTETAEYRALDKEKITPQQLAEYYVHQSMDFSAGSKWNYNNANFYILGYLIEKLSGLPYDAYLQEHIFKPAGMKNTYVGKEEAIIKNRAHGYTNFRLGIFNATPSPSDYKLMYSSGAIQSTVDDMFLWNRALIGGKLLKKETLAKAYSPQKLSDGSLTNYGFGWHLQELRKSPTIRHGGLVKGFAAETLYLPQEDVYVVMLLNQESRVPLVALVRILASIVIEKPYRFVANPAITTDISQYVGLYKNKANELINITQESNKLYFQRPGGVRYLLQVASKNNFFFERNHLWVEFQDDANGKITALDFSQVGVGATIWQKTNQFPLVLLPDRLPENVLNEYTGKYLVAGRDSIIIKKEGSGIVLQQGTQPKKNLVANTMQKFTVLNEDLSLEFQKNEKGIFDLMIEQNKQKTVAKRVE